MRSEQAQTRVITQTERYVNIRADLLTQTVCQPLKVPAQSGDKRFFGRTACAKTTDSNYRWESQWKPCPPERHRS